MTFRSKLFLFFTLALLLLVGLISAGVTVVSRRAFADLNRRHSDALVAQFQREFARRAQDVTHQVQGVADAEANRPHGD